MARISVFLADWQVLFREGIHFTLSGEDDIEVIGEAASSDEALREIEANPPDVAVLNSNHDELSGVRAARRLRQDYPLMAVLLITDADDEEHLFLAVKSGARACLTKEADPDDLIGSIRAVAQGGQPIRQALRRPGIAARVLAEFEQSALMAEQLDHLLARLTPGEAEILRRIADGETVEQVAQKLSINEATIERHFGTIITKLVSNDHARQVIESAQKGLLSSFLQSRLTGASADYVTREEFAAFKNSLRERLRGATGETVL
jgi:DNA-binding NarL/FixJ family response regulator